MSDKPMYEAAPNCWTITHPEMGGPLEVVSASAYDALVEEVERRTNTSAFLQTANHLLKEAERLNTEHVAELADLRRVNAVMAEALKSIIELGKRDLSNSKYDGYFYTARNALREYKRQAEGK